MKKAVKAITWVLVLFVLVCVCAIAALYFLADPNKLKPVIASEVKKRTGYEMTFDGALSWSLYPQVGVKAQHVTLRAPDQQKPFVDLKRVHIAVEPWQLMKGTSKLSGEVHIAECTFMNVRATSALVGVHWQDKALILRPVQASLYDGTMSGTVRGKDFSATPAWNWDITLSHVNMLPLVSDANGTNSKLKLSGTGQLRINASTKGLNKQQMLANLNGATDFSIQNGAVEGIDLNYWLQTADALLHKKPANLPQGDKETKFSTLAGSLLINNGIAQTTNMILKAPAFNVKGQGEYNLPANTMDLALQVSPPDTNKANWNVPVIIKGESARPTVQLDMSEINKQIAVRELDKMKSKVRGQIKEHVPGKAGEYLQSLIGN